MHFEGKSAVQETLRRITTRLGELGIDYAVVGGMALFAHGLRRFTEDVDILVTRDCLRQVHQILEGSGYRPPFLGSKNLRDTETGVRIDFHVSDRLPTPRLTDCDGVKYLNLPALLELKLASGMTNRDRLKDLVDVQELIRLFHLPENYTENLNPYVHDQYGELWRAVSGREKRYIQSWQGSALSPEITSLADALAAVPAADAAALRAMQADGVTLDQEASRPGEGRLVFVTTDPVVAERHGLHDAAEFWDDNTSAG